MQQLKLVFMGTSAFALPVLETIINSRHILEAVITIPDRPQGRGYKLVPSPVKQKAEQEGFPLYQPSSLQEEDFFCALKAISPHLLVVVDFGKMVPQELVEMASKGGINLHPSLLPYFRGPAPIQRAIMAGAVKTGVSVIYLEKKMDGGDIICQEEEAILPEDTAGDLRQRLSLKGARVLGDSIEMIASGEVSAVPQEEALATYAPPVEKNEARLNWEQEGKDLANIIRALNPTPGAFTFLRGKRVKIWKAKYSPAIRGEHPGEIIEIDASGIWVAAGKAGVLLEEVQPEGKKKMSAAEFARGYRLEKKERFGGEGD